MNSTPQAEYPPQSVLKKLETGFESILFAARWMLAPFYVGMVGALAVILVVFFRELIGELAHVADIDAERALVLALSLIDLSLTANLLLIMILAGYENFVSKLHMGDHEDRPAWMGTVDFADLKIKLIASIVAISAISLLRAFLPLAEENTHVDAPRLLWMIAIHLTFVVSALLLAVMDWIASKTTPHAITHG